MDCAALPCRIVPCKLLVHCGRITQLLKFCKRVATSGSPAPFSGLTQTMQAWLGPQAFVWLCADPSKRRTALLSMTEPSELPSVPKPKNTHTDQSTSSRLTLCVALATAIGLTTVAQTYLNASPPNGRADERIEA
jgi:hypothetical protein